MVTDDAPRLVVGLVRGLHGLRGVLRVEVLTDDPSRFEVGRVVYAEGSGEPLTIAWSRADGPGLRVRFRERPTREEAEPLRGSYLEVRGEGTALPPGSYYWHQIEGTPVLTLDGESLGTVVDIFRTGGSEVYVVRGGPRGEVLVPAVGAVIRELAPESGRIVVDAAALGLAQMRAPRPRGRRTTRALRAASATDTGASPQGPTVAADGSEPPGEGPESAG